MNKFKHAESHEENVHADSCTTRAPDDAGRMHTQTNNVDGGELEKKICYPKTPVFSSQRSRRSIGPACPKPSQTAAAAFMDGV